MKKLVLSGDLYEMNWVEGAVEWGTVRAPASIGVQTVSGREGDTVFERYTFTNISGAPLFTSLKDIAIYTPFNDDYCGAEECTVRRCHAHIFCGGGVSWVCALRMGGEPPHLGLVLTEGSLGGYSVERDPERMSNDRGDFLLHPSPVFLDPGESFSVAWRLFRHEGKEDFFRQLPKWNPHYIQVRAEQYVVFAGEKVRLEITPAFPFAEKDAVIRREEAILPFCADGGKIRLEETGLSEGEHTYSIEVEGYKTYCRIRVMPPFEELVRRRVRFLVEKQQFHKEGSALDGAFLIYDREEEHLFYSPENDYNGGRERVSMGILLARYLQKNSDPEAGKSLRQYVAYLEREIFDAAHDLVCNDIGYNDSYKRLYNYPWMSVLYLELFDLYGERQLLEKACRILESFYRQGGGSFYAIEIPLERIMRTLQREGMEAAYAGLMRCFAGHCDTILENDILYPPHEVNFEQSIVAPAADLLVQMCLLTGEERYRAGAERQIRVLEQFQLPIPDCRQYEVAIRHWDGYWFGKKRQYGDTYPHYWSALSGNVYRGYAALLEKSSGGEREGQDAGERIRYYKRLAESTARGVLPLFFADGGASCAYVFPKQVNGVAADRYDAYANDQDWGMYFYLRSHGENHS